MNRFEGLIRGIFWLCKRDWGRSILLGIASILAMGFLSEQFPIFDVILNGRVYRAGFYVGTILMPNETFGGHSLFGMGADFLMLTALWFVILQLVHVLFDRKARV